jgi:hypothetical protein
MSFWQTVEAKVKSAAFGALAASVVAAVLNALLSGSPIPDSPHAWLQFVIIVVGPPVVAFVRGFQAPHTSIPPVPTGGDTPAA